MCYGLLLAIFFAIVQWMNDLTCLESSWVEWKKAINNIQDPFIRFIRCIYDGIDRKNGSFGSIDSAKHIL